MGEADERAATAAPAAGMCGRFVVMAQSPHHRVIEAGTRMADPQQGSPVIARGRPWRFNLPQPPGGTT